MQLSGREDLGFWGRWELDVFEIVEYDVVGI